MSQMNSKSDDAGAAAPRSPCGRMARHVRREHFIPIRKSDLIKRLSESTMLPEDQRSLFLGFCRLLDATFHFEFHACFEQLKDAYAPFNPDAATLGSDPLPATTRRQRYLDELFGHFQQLLLQANFVKLDRSAIEEAIGAASDWGVRLDVDLDVFEHLDVYTRGDVVGLQKRRRWRNLLRVEMVEVPMHERLVVIFRLSRSARLAPNVSPEAVYIKLFKNIPKQDVDMLLPASSVKMTWLDRGRIILPTLSGVSMSIYKIVQTGLLLAFASVQGMLMFLGLVGGTIGYGVKSFFGYLRTKDKYQHHLTRSLYYQNLDNNAGVLFRILDEAETQEFCEALLAYFLLWRKAGEEGWTQEQTDQQVEALLAEILETPVDFEVDDALGKLARLDLARQTSDQRWVAAPVDVALERLDRAWDAYFQYASNEPPGP